MAGPLAARPPMDPHTARASRTAQQQFSERFETLIPTIQREWPEVARQTLEATRGSLDEVAEVIAEHTGKTVSAVTLQLQDLLQVAGEQTHRLADVLEPLEQQLEDLLDELNANLRPRIEKPVRERPLLALGLAGSIGVLLGLMLASGRRSG
ncbi:MAG: hypothetical protein ACO23C_05625 [Prochlorococcaceae cyanobacterium]